MASTKASALNIAEIVLQRAMQSTHPMELATAELATYAALAQQEAPGNPYSPPLMSVVADLERGVPIQTVLAQVQEKLKLQMQPKHTPTFTPTLTPTPENHAWSGCDEEADVADAKNPQR